MKLFARIALTALALLLVSRYLEGVEIDTLFAAVVAAVVLGLLNGLVRPVLIILTLPITILTLGAFILIINGGLFYLVASFVDGFYVSSFLSALIGSILVSIISIIGNRFIE